VQQRGNGGQQFLHFHWFGDKSLEARVLGCNWGASGRAKAVRAAAGIFIRPLRTAAMK